MVTVSAPEVLEVKEDDELSCAVNAAAEIWELGGRVVCSLTLNKKHGFLATARNIPFITRAAILFLCSYINRYLCMRCI